MARKSEVSAPKSEQPGLSRSTNSLSGPLSGFSLSDAPLLLALALAPFLAGHLDPLVPAGLATLIGLGIAWRAGTVGLGTPPRSLMLLGLLVPALSFGLIIISANQGASLYHSLWTLTLVGAAWHAGDLARRGRALQPVLIVLAAGLVVAALGLREHLEAAKTGDRGWRSFVTFTNPNFLCGYLAPCLLVAVGAVLRRPAGFRPETWSLAAGLVLVTLAGGTAVTGSRGGFLAFGVGIGVLLVVLLFQRRAPGSASGRSFWLGLLGALLAIGVGFGAFSGSWRGREIAKSSTPLPPEIFPKGMGSAADESNRFRIATWKGTLAMGLKRPITGWGPGSFETAFPPHQQAAFTRHAHNTYLQWFAEQGIPGLVLLLAAVAAALLPAFRRLFQDPVPLTAGLLGATACTGAQNLLDSAFYVPAVGLQFAVWCGLLAGPGWGEPLVSRRRVSAGLAVAAAMFNVVIWVGRTNLEQGREAAGRQEYSQAEASIRLATSLLPWDQQAATTAARVYHRMTTVRGAGMLDDALAAARRAVSQAPYRPSGYQTLANLVGAKYGPVQALAQVELGLTRVPQDVELLYLKATLLEGLGRIKERRQTYQRILEIENSPLGQIQALGEYRYDRFPRAHLGLAQELDHEGKTAEAFKERLTAAGLLAERRQLHDRNPSAYITMFSWNPSNEVELRDLEEATWEWLIDWYQEKGDQHMVGLCREQLEAARKSRDKVPEIANLYREARAIP